MREKPLPAFLDGRRVGHNAKTSKRARGKRGESRNSGVVGQSVLCIALNIPALTPVLLLVFPVDVTVAGGGGGS